MSELPTAALTRRKPRRLRRWLAILCITFLVAAAGTFYQLTRPERLRAYAERWLREFSGADVAIDRVELHLHGLKLVGVRLAVPVGVHFDPSDDSPAARNLFQASSLVLSLQWRSLLSGSITAKQVVAFDPELTFVQRDDGMDNWKATLKHRKAVVPASLPAALPGIQLRNARFIQYRLRKGARVSAPAQTIWAQATPSTSQPAMYDIQLTRLVLDDKSRDFRPDTGRLRVDLNTLAMNGELPSLRFDELLFLTSPEMVSWIDRLALKGSVRPERIELHGETHRVSLELSDVSLSVPIDEFERSLPPEKRYVRLDNIHGRLELANTAAQVELEGAFRGVPFKVSGAATLPVLTNATFEALGFDLKLEASRVPLPHDDPDRDPAESRTVRRWTKLSNFVRDFDAVGPADVFVHLRKTPSSQRGIEVVDGDLRPLGVSARYIRFPYRVSNLTGLVHFRPDGTETLDLKGSRGSSPISVTGWEGGFKTQAGELTIHGSGLTLDEDLKRCLTPEDQSLIDRFELKARMDLNVHMTRADAPPGTRNNPWKPAVDVTLLDGATKFEGFPYPLERLNGRISVSDGSMRIAELTAHRQDADVRVTGEARWAGLPNAEINLQLEAESVPLDAMLAAALPPEAQKLYRDLSPTGGFDLVGRLQSKPDSSDLIYDLNIHMMDSNLVLPTAGRLTAIDARLNLKPDRMTIGSLQVMLGASHLTGEGWIGMGHENRPYSVHVSSDQLRLDAALHDALPPDYQGLWDDFEPSGVARLDLRIEQNARKPAEGDSHAERGGESPAELNRPRYRIKLDPLGASATYAGFPLPLQNVRGSFIATNAGVEIPGIQARSGEASIEFSGMVEPVGEHNHTRLAVKARRLKFDDTLRRVLPPRIRRQWDTIKPRGQMDVEFRDLDFTTGTPTGSWRFNGQADLRDVDAEIGPSLSQMNGRVSGSIEIGEQIAIDSQFLLDRVRVDGRLVTKASATLQRSSSESVVSLRDLKGKFYDGDVAGHADIDYLPTTPTFSVNLAAHGVSLEKLLNAKRGSDQEQVRARGIVDGSLSFSGRFDDPASRKGDGDVNIRQAQVFKIPLMFSILQVLNLTLDDNAFHDARIHFNVNGSELLLDEIDLRGKALSMVGSGRVDTVSENMNLAFLVGPAMRLPRIAVLTDLLEGVARELMEVRVEGKIEKPAVRAEVVRSLRKTIDSLLALAQPRTRPR